MLKEIKEKKAASYLNPHLKSKQKKRMMTMNEWSSQKYTKQASILKPPELH
jgi:hypothetical protein